MENQFKEQHFERKKSIIQCLQDAEQFLTEHGHPEEASRIAVQRNNLEKGEFSIFVVGEFSAGKSTFLNALMRERILPSFSKETTATINFLRHKDKAENGESGCVHYTDGRTETFRSADLKTISKYVSTKSDFINVAKSVKYLDLFLDSRFLEGNVTLVDTPGLNGIAEGHRDMTMEQIEKSSAGIFLFDANKPGSHSDFEFLGELQKRIKNIIFVLNKIDNIKKSEGETVESVIQKLKENYKTMFPEAETIPEIWAVAAYPALVARSHTKMDYNGKTEFTSNEREEFEKNSHMREFEDRLWRFLTQGEKTRQELLSPIVQLISQLSNIKESYDTELSLLKGSVDKSEIEAKQIELEQALANLSETLSQETTDVRSRIRDAEKEFEEAVKSGCQEIEDRISRSFDNFTSIDEIEPENQENKIKKQLVNTIMAAYDAYLNALNEIVETRTTEVLDLVNEGFSNSISASLNQKLKLTSFEVGLEDYEKQQDALQAEIDKLSVEVESATNNKWKQMELQQKRNKKEKELESLRERKDNYVELSSSRIPSIQRYTEQDYEKEKRSGVLGAIKTFFVGEKYRPVERTMTDDTEYRRYMEERTGILKNYDEQIQKAEEELGKLEDVHLEAAEKILNHKNELLRQKRAEKERRDEIFAKKMKETSEKQLRKQKVEVLEFAAQLCQDCLDETAKKFREERKSRTQTILELIAGKITRQIELKKQELEHLQNQNQQAVQERDERISEIEKENQQIEDLLFRATGLQGEIESIRTDIIMQEEL